MNDESLPFLGDQTQNEKMQSFIFPAIIIVVSVIKFFSSTLELLTQISTKSWYYILPLALNVFSENEVPSMIINPLLAFVLGSLLIRKWEFNKVLAFSTASAVISNFISFIVMLVLSIIPGFPEFSVCGSLSLSISLSVAICYAYKPEKMPLFGRVELKPSEIFGIVAIWAFCNFRWPPTALVSAASSIYVSFYILTNLQDLFKLQRSETNFTFNSLSPFQKEEEEQKQPSLLEALSIPTTSTQELSEADQSRRMRAIRAIEERLESLQNNQ